MTTPSIGATMRYLAELGFEAVDRRLGGVAPGSGGRERLAARVRLLRLSGRHERKDAIQPVAKLFQTEGHFDFGQAVMGLPQGGLHLVGAELNQQVALVDGCFFVHRHVVIVPRTSVPDGHSGAGIGDHPPLGRDSRERPSGAIDCSLTGPASA